MEPACDDFPVRLAGIYNDLGLALENAGLAVKPPFYFEVVGMAVALLDADEK
jgi:hypothetical protein